MTFTLRPTTPADALAVHAVMMSAGMDPRSSWVRTTIADVEWSLSKGAGFLALRGGAAVGCVGSRPDGYRTLTLNKLATRPEVRGQGIGAALVRAVEAQARAGGFGRVLLAVSLYNLGVLPFYEHLGYAVSSEPYAFAHPDSPPPVVLVKPILREAPP
ncbi:GNAT family N-acetyltransferase [Deinococcus altitudinis]|uniref:GNAT family N-acetyltransferase n=1 Tax=Deinococcus altitudinis TaxID=468914 RepID=UPI00389181A6